MSKDIRYSLSTDGEERKYYGSHNVYGDDIALPKHSLSNEGEEYAGQGRYYFEDMTLPKHSLSNEGDCTQKPKRKSTENYHAELFYLYATMRKKKEEIKKNKFKRLVITTLAFIAFFTIFTIVAAGATGIEVLYAVIGSAIWGIAHVAINAPIFSYLESLNDEDWLIVERIRNQIKAIEQNTKRW